MSRLPVRATGIVIKGKKLLVIQRLFKGRQYYVFPGGKVEKGESTEVATAREVFEETSIKVKVGKLLYAIHLKKNSRMLFYLCHYVSGSPALGNFNEKRNMQKGKDLYFPKWVRLPSIKKLLLYSLEVRDWLLEDIKNDFVDTPRKISITTREYRQR